MCLWEINGLSYVIIKTACGHVIDKKKTFPLAIIIISHCHTVLCASRWNGEIIVVSVSVFFSSLFISALRFFSLSQNTFHSRSDRSIDRRSWEENQKQLIHTGSVVWCPLENDIYASKSTIIICVSVWCIIRQWYIIRYNIQFSLVTMRCRCVSMKK